jgi:hypothetical protein
LGLVRFDIIGKEKRFWGWSALTGKVFDSMIEQED